MASLPKLLHLVAAILWMGGMAFLMLALRPAVQAQLEPAVRLPLMATVLGRFFVMVWLSVIVLLATGLSMLLDVGPRAAPLGWHLMLGLGLLMMLIFGHVWFGPFRRLKQAVAAADWPEGGRRIAQVVLLAKINLSLGWAAIAAVLLLR
ncbi:MAG: CopD family protein [Ramlibacter sp.]|nr:CopD family protein [Ramlibacter sp.]MBX3660294.1 CopD family protein [Ramlibacter sp.]MCW5651761.1 CopD family protein [Ramlibacter sp.]